LADTVCVVVDQQVQGFDAAENRKIAHTVGAPSRPRGLQQRAVMADVERGAKDSLIT
jgi:hypothetical protein